ncbi:WD40-repeat-containing domain protein [Tribonema minus]|uniref:Pre-mRNA-processing factor 17 n=1 Tax=Tribonema minus TaxID=303371 RepID=A0A836CBI0_9STRA|nr:WD40-repeat-containing domain protein [Tribonema minus]
MDLLQGYASGSGADESGSEAQEEQPMVSVNLKPQLQTRAVVAAPTVIRAPEHAKSVVNPLSAAAGPVGQLQTARAPGQMMMYNPKADLLLAPVLGPAHPFRASKMEVPVGGSHTGAGVVERASIEDWSFQEQYHTFQQHKYTIGVSGDMVGDVAKGLAVEQAGPPQRERKRKHRERDAAAAAAATGITDVGDEVTTGIWAPQEDETRVVPDAEAGTMTEAQAAFREAYLAEKAKKQREYNMEEDHDRRDERKMGHLLPPRHDRDTTAAEAKTTFHGKKEADYKGKSWVEPPGGHRAGVGDHQAFPPKKCIHRWTGHTKGVQAIEFFPGFGHLILSGSMDGKCKVWDVLGDRQARRTYSGHSAAVRDVKFSNDGRRFLSAGYDRFVRLWDTETGQCVRTFTNRKMPYTVTFYPEDNNIFLAGCSDNKIVQWDVNTGEVVQEYNHHLAPVNTVLFVDDNQRFVSTSDDKKVLVWEYGIPVPIKYISEPHMHSMPAVALHPSGNYWVGQSLDNQILAWGARDKFRQNRKKIFKGHTNAGYACRMDFSPNGKYLASGDGEGRLFVWDWGSTKVYRKLAAHTDGPCIDVKWHPTEASWVATAGWDGIIKLWD